jgi:Arc/MetJ-type ribon-helix-helix transcriptional regulator
MKYSKDKSEIVMFRLSPELYEKIRRYNNKSELLRIALSEFFLRREAKENGTINDK